MAKEQVRNPFGRPVTLKFIQEIEKTINSNPAILSSDIQKYFGPDCKTAYIKGNVLFINSSCLEVALFVKETESVVSVDKYRFHYMDSRKQILFRYDNAPHHPGLPNHPHHKHTANQVIPAKTPNLKDVLNEISAVILKK